jgi:hypothetical protein
VYHLADTFNRFLAIFEDYIFGVWRIWLKHYPASLSKKQIEVGVILETGNLDDVLNSIIDRELNEQKYKKPAEWFENLRKLTNIDPPPNDDIAKLAEMKATRDIIIHNAWIVNSVYLLKSGPLARAAIGDRIELTEPYHRECWLLVRRLIEHIDTTVATKFPNA